MSHIRINLNCPFGDKDQARALGARWDGASKKWFINSDQVSGR